MNCRTCRRHWLTPVFPGRRRRRVGDRMTKIKEELYIPPSPYSGAVSTVQVSLASMAWRADKWWKDPEVKSQSCWKCVCVRYRKESVYDSGRVCVEDSETGPWLCSTSLILLRASAPKPISTGGFSPSPDLKEISTLLGVSTSKTVHFFLVCLFVCVFFLCVLFVYLYSCLHCS